MDPVSLAFITAVGAGVTGSITDATKASLAAGYKALKERVLEKVHSRHPKVPAALAELEAAPTSQARQAVLVEEITAAQLPHDTELLALAQSLLQQMGHSEGGVQLIQQVEHSSISNSGTATTYNIAGDQHITHP